MDSEKLIKNLLCCSSCKKSIVFELIEEIECDWGSHPVIQCPECEELFSVDRQCPAFQDLMALHNFNKNLFTEKEIQEYSRDPHPN